MVTICACLLRHCIFLKYLSAVSDQIPPPAPRQWAFSAAQSTGWIASAVGGLIPHATTAAPAVPKLCPLLPPSPNVPLRHTPPPPLAPLLCGGTTRAAPSAQSRPRRLRDRRRHTWSPSVATRSRARGAPPTLPGLASLPPTPVSLWDRNIPTGWRRRDPPQPPPPPQHRGTPPPAGPRPTPMHARQPRLPRPPPPPRGAGRWPGGVGRIWGAGGALDGERCASRGSVAARAAPPAPGRPPLPARAPLTWGGHGGGGSETATTARGCAAGAVGRGKPHAFRRGRAAIFPHPPTSPPLLSPP